MKNSLDLQLNEVMEYGVDNSIEEELKIFHNKVKNIKRTEIKEFKNWIKVYKALNYDIFKDLVIEDIYKFNNNAAIVELNFKGLKEYDLLLLDDEHLIVTVMNVKEGMVKTQKIRRLLVPQNTDEALKYAVSQLYFNDMDDIAITMKEIEENGKRYSVMNELKEQLSIYNNTPKKELTKEEKEEEMKKSVNRQPLNKENIKTEKPKKKSLFNCFKVIYGK
jgi:hypothetical protein